MKITLCGSARFEKEFREYDERLSLLGHTVYNLAVYPSEKGGKEWYTPAQKLLLDSVHRDKILNSDAILVIAPGCYVGESTASEIDFAKRHGKSIMSCAPLPNIDKRLCPYRGCADFVNQTPVCALCYD